MYWFILGREKLLSTAEIAAVTRYHPKSTSGSVLKLDQKIDSELIKQLGGTIKIGKEIAINLTVDKLKAKMVDELKQIEGKIHFGVSIYSIRGGAQSIDERLGLEVKKELKKLGKSVRFVEGQHGVLNSAQIKYNKLIDKGAEFLIEVIDKKFNLAKMIAVQDVDEFSERDFGRPGRDDLSGMLPPKLAMMMINLAQAKLDDVILDPFCGSGTIITEAMLMGYKNLTGSDLSEKAIEDTKKNIVWLKNNNRTIEQSNIELFTADAVQLSSKITKNSVNAIITEPYLGRPLYGNESEAQIRSQAEELKNLYLAALAEFTKILKPHGTIIFIVPRFKNKNSWITIDIKNEIKKLGLISEPLLPGQEFLLYARPDQKVGREIWKFKKI
ncbi:MAG: DNA methyltransferase [Candidatus Magasanikbacteria bacterium]